MKWLFLFLMSMWLGLVGLAFGLSVGLALLFTWLRNKLDNYGENLSATIEDFFKRRMFKWERKPKE